MKRIGLLILIVFSGLQIQGQPLRSIYENTSFVSFEKYVYNTDSAFHTSVKPYLVSDLKKNFGYEKILSTYLISKRRDSSVSLSSKSAFNILFNRNLFLVEKNGYGFTLDPLFDWGAGYDFTKGSNTWINTRGFLITGHLGKDFAFATTFYETQAKTTGWITDYIVTRTVMPGQGHIKGFGPGAYDYANASGYISWSPGRFFNFSAGHGKQFLGDGYRSLLLSDVSLYHPYFMVTTSFWKIKYVNLFSQYSHPDVIAFQGEGDAIFAKKYSAMHYLSFLPWKKLNVSLFETILWQGADSTQNRGFELSYLNPVIFLRPLEFNLGSGDNALIGLNIRYTPLNKYVLYGQFIIDEFKLKELKSGKGWVGNKFAFQAGIKLFDLGGINDLYLQLEGNIIRPYMYSHFAEVQNYSHSREPLAHPSGANIKEVLAIAKYNYKRLYFNAKYIWSSTGLDEGNVNSGKNIFKDPLTAPAEYGNFITQGLYTTLNQFDGSVSLLVNPSTNANLFISYTWRKTENSQEVKSYSYLGFGFRTSLRSLYYDFL